MEAEFIAKEGPLKGVILSLSGGDEWILGRDPENCHIIVEDLSVARQQARVRKEGEDYIISNLSEEQPLLINDEPLTGNHTLHNGDKIFIGETLLSFSSGEEEMESVGFTDETEAFEEEVPQEIVSEEEEALQEEEPQEEETSAEEIPQEEEETVFEEEPIFEEEESSTFNVDLTESTRFLLKVIAGPNTGAEFGLDFDRTYIVGTDTVNCDIVFNDLSISHKHASLTVDKEGAVVIEDLNSRNGVVVDKERITTKKQLLSNSVVTLGTSAFLLIDRDAPAETIVAPIIDSHYEEEEESVEEIAEPVAITPVKEKKSTLSFGSIILVVMIGGLALFLGFGLFSLFDSETVELPRSDQMLEIQNVINEYPAVRFTYNSSFGKLFLMGHVKTGVERNELLYKLHSLGFIKGYEDNVVNDEAVWQEMNILLSKQREFKGVSMHAPEAGVFVLSGYLTTDKQAADLADYMNINFNYLGNLQNRVVVEQEVVDEITSQLLQKGYDSVNVQFLNGELQLTGYVSSAKLYSFDELIKAFETIPGIRSIRNFVVAISPEQGVINLNQKYPNRFEVTGYSRHGDVNVNVVINGRILSRGDEIDGMIITSIHPRVIFLSKDGLNYKIEYNK